MTHDPKRNIWRQVLDDLDRRIFDRLMGQRIAEWKGARIAHNVAEAYRPEGLS